MMASTSDKIESILQNLTIQEKVSLLAGKDFWETVPVPGKNVPGIKTSDGPNGARGEVFSGGTRAACFPAAVCSASTWNPTLSRRIGNALAEETLTKSSRVLLGPTMCNHRHPLGGRNFESFSEDPLLTGKMAAQVVSGLQEKGVAATIKHFAANEQETDRLAVDEIISERALREIYLRPFEIAIKEANPWAVMTAYNQINGVHADSHAFLLEQVLRGEWGWKGLVMSDWGGTNSTAAAINAGLDLEMPGPTKWRSWEAVEKALKSGDVTEATVNERVRNVLELIEKVGAFKDATIPPEQSVDNPEHRKLIRQTAGEGIVLLKNDKLLPLTRAQAKGKKIALLGLAKEALIHGGGSASLHAHYRITPWDALHEAYGTDVEFTFAKGAQTYRQLSPLTDSCTDNEGQPGWTLEYFKDQDDKPAKTVNGHKVSAFSPLGSDEAKGYEIRLSTTFVPTSSGSHYLSGSGMGPTTVTINNKVVFEQKVDSPDAMAFLFGGNAEKEFTYPFTKGESYHIHIRSTPPGAHDNNAGILAGLPGFCFGFMDAQEHDEDLLSQAVDLARDSDFAIVFTGHTPVWETEGQDQAGFNLPRDGSQDRLVEAVADANSKTIVVNSTGVAVATPWLPKVSAMLQAWFPGQEAGNAIADIITGDVNPSGKLPISWPTRIEDAPAHGNFPGEKVDKQLTVEYKEGIFVGYRHFDRASVADAQFPFGFGLTYSSYELQIGQIKQTANDAFEANITVKNTGKVAGATVVQLYAGRAVKSADHPVKMLVAFKKVHVEPGQEESVALSFGILEVSYFDEASKKWRVDKGKYDFSFGQSSAHIEDVVSLDLEASEVAP